MFNRNMTVISNLSEISSAFIVKNMKLPTILHFTPLGLDLPCT